MPLLFFVSGILASRAIRSGRGRKPEKRIATLLYFIVVWTVLYITIGSFSSRNLPDAPSTGISGFVNQFFRPETPLWFLLALAYSTTLSLMLRKVSPWLSFVILVAFTLLIIFLPIPYLKYQWRIVAYAPLFFLGETLSGTLLKQQPRILFKWLSLSVPVFILVTIIAPLVTFDSRVLSYSQSLIGMVASSFLGLFISLGLTFIKPVGSLLAYIGKNSMPIYMLNLPLVWLIISSDTIRNVLSPTQAEFLWPLIDTAFCIIIGVFVKKVIDMSPFTFLFEMPRVAVSRAETASVQRIQS